MCNYSSLQFRDPSEIILICSRNSCYYQYWKQLLNVFVDFFSEFFDEQESVKEQHLFENRNLL